MIYADGFMLVGFIGLLALWAALRFGDETTQRIAERILWVSIAAALLVGVYAIITTAVNL